MSGKSEDVRRKAAAMATEQKAKERRRRLLMFSGAGAAVVAVVAVGVISGLSGSLGSATAGTSTSGAQSPAQGSAQAPPWAAPADASSRAQSAGLTMLTAEGTAEHIHTHLSITADGKAITVPADVGIDLSAQLISPLHTHDTSGIIHVESPVQKEFTLGEFFTEWNVALSAKQLGSYTTAGGYTITTFVNGTKYAGDAADIALAEHEDVDIVISTGSSQASAPAAFSWPAGY